MKICMIATRHSLDDARVVHKEAISLGNAGHDVFLVISCNDVYEYVRKDGSVIAAGKGLNGEVVHMGLKVFGRPKRKGLLGKWKMYLELSRLAADLKADVYHAHEPDLSLAIAVRTKRLLAKQGFRAHVVHDMHEYPPGEPADNAPQLLKLPILLAHILWNKLSMKWVDQVFTANNIVRGYALALSYQKSVDVLYNAPSLKVFPQPTRKSWLAKGERLLLCHEGSLPFDRGLKEMIEAVYSLRDRVCLRIVGDVFGEERAWLKREIDEKNLHDTITITGWLPYEKVSEAINDCHVGLILFRICIENRLAGPPNKLFNYMNAGLPVLSVDFPEMRQIIVEEECGILICDQSVKSIIDAIEFLLANPENLRKLGENGQKAVRERYSWEVMEIKLLLSYERLSRMAC
jgi:glycosyltransferase involved in cell wall biosynthesis